MSKRYLTLEEDGSLTITHLADIPGSNIQERVAKALYEQSRTTEMDLLFNPAIHTLEAIEAGISGHRPLSLLAECEDTDLPSDLYFREAWEVV